MTDEATFTLTLDPDLRDRFIAEADATMQAPEDVLRDLMRDFVARRRSAEAGFQAEITQAIREADDPSAEFISNDEVEADWSRQRAKLVQRIPSDAA